MIAEDHELAGEPPQDELWLVSYADLLTLLLGFFVLLLGASQLKGGRFEQIAASLTGAKQAAPLEGLRGRVEEVIAKGGLRDRVRTVRDAEGLGIELKDALLFESGSAEVRAEGSAVIAQVARLLGELPARPIVVEGHTDDVPIHTAQYRSNWELSAQRAINVLLALEASGVSRARLSARGFADTRPLARIPRDGARGIGLPRVAEDGDDLVGARAQNRRVVIHVE
jgi:chemotaxis protein MotB